MHVKFRTFIGLVSLVAPLALGAQDHAATATQDTAHATGADSASILSAAQGRSPERVAEAQEHAAARGAEQAENIDFITPHITDGHHMELPWPLPPFYKEIHLPEGWYVNIGGMQVDLAPTKHVFFMGFAALTAILLLVGAARSSRRSHATKGHPRGFAAGIEAMALYLRNEVVLPNVGHHGEKFVPFLLSLFFFILCCNLWGLVPWGATATGNISVTATLAIITFFVVEAAGIRANGLGYLNTMFYWNKDLPIYMRVPMFLLMSPIEMIGKLTKPFALAIRLFANMTAGHIVVLAIIGLIFSFRSWAIAGAPVLMATAIMMLELFVSFLQAFIFTLLSAVFIGQIREAHH